MSGLRVLFMEGPLGLAKPLEPELAACLHAVRVETVSDAEALGEALRHERWDVVVVASDAAISGKEVAALVGAYQPGIAVVSASVDALRSSLRRLRRAIEGSDRELSRTRSELNTREEQLRQAQKMEVIGSFAGGIAHDFNNIIMSIGGYAALLLQDWPADQPGRQDIEEIVRSAEQAQALTRQLLGFARKEAHQARRLDLAEVIRDVDQLLRRSAGSKVRIDVRLQEGASAIRSDANQLQQVLLNLVLNARDAMPSGGGIRIGVDEVTLDSPLDAVDGPLPPGDWVRLTVQDSGIGMDEVARRRAIEPFYTTKAAGRGTGLGLAIVHDILHRAGAHMRLLSEPGQGTTFEIFFPPDTSPEPDAAEVAPDHGGQTILLVEDEPTLRSLVTRLLKRAGYIVRSAANAEDALDVARLHSGPLHLLLTDVVLPTRNGRELAEDVAELRPGIATLYMSGYADDVIQRAGLDMARARILDKPFRPEDLYHCVREALASGTATDDVAADGAAASGTAVDGEAIAGTLPPRP